MSASLSSPISPLERYEALTQKGELNADPVQKNAMEALNSLYEEVLHPSLRASGTSAAIHTKLYYGLLRQLRFLAMTKSKNIKGLYMHGGVGRGKSMLMDLFYACLPDDLPKSRVHFHEFMIDVHDTINQRGGHGYDRALPALAADIAKDSRILCFDEFHVTDIADAMILGRLFTALFDHGVVVVATSNWAPDDLYKDGLQRELFLPFIDLLQQRMDVLHLDHDTDYRAEFIAEEGRYFAPLNQVTKAKMDDLFTRATEHTKIISEDIEVKGRKIRVDQAAGNVARLTFQQLCERPHGAEDYLALAQRFSMLFLENIPIMKYDRRNEAKRFMILIDALYEAGTQVIFSADGPPEKLYSGDDHAYEFERTISRLNEMQSAEWDKC